MSERSEELKLKLISRIKRDTELLAELTPKDEKVIETFKELKERVSKKPKIPKYETGVEWLDRRTRGIEAGTYINLAGQSFSGKTTLALKILTNISEYKKAALFSFEMYEDKLVKELPNLTINQEKNLLIIQKQYELYEMDGTIRSLSSQGIRFFVIDSRMKVKVSIEGQEVIT